MISYLDEKLVDSIRRHEGLRLHPYTDTRGFITIGYGRNLSTRGIDQEEAEALLEKDLWNAHHDAMSVFGESLFYAFPEDVQRVLVEMAFQMGRKGLASFRKLRAALLEGDWERAAAEMLDSRWAQQTPSRARELAEMVRRAAKS